MVLGTRSYFCGHTENILYLRYSLHLGNILSRTSSVSLRLLTPTRSAMLPRTTKRSVLVMAPLPWTSQIVKHSDALSKAEPRAVTQRKSRSSLQCTYLGLGGEIEVINVNIFWVLGSAFVSFTLFRLDPSLWILIGHIWLHFPEN